MLTAGAGRRGAVSVSACKEVETASATGYEPAKLEEVKGNEDLKVVTFTKEGAERTGSRRRRSAGRAAARSSRTPR